MDDHAAFQATLDALAPMLDWVHSQTEKAGFSTQESHKIELALEEAIVNVIHHAYGDKGGNLEIRCSISPQQKIEFKLKDQGPPFNPVIQAPQVELSKPLEEKKEGGLGIFLIRQYMDHIDYERADQHNILRLTKLYM